MWYPNEPQWRVIWTVGILGLFFWSIPILSGSSYDEDISRVVLGVLGVIGFLLVWRLGRPKGDRKGRR